MQAIVVKFISATNTKGARLKATAKGGSLTIGYPHDLHNEDKYRAAALALCDKMKWPSETLIEGVLPNGNSVFVFSYQSK